MAKMENLYHTATVAVEHEIIIITFLCQQTQQPTYLHQQLPDDRVLPPFLRGLHDGVPAGLLVLQGLSAHWELHLPWRKQGSASPAGQSQGNMGLCLCWALSGALQRRFSKKRTKLETVFSLDPSAAFQATSFMMATWAGVGPSARRVEEGQVL